MDNLQYISLHQSKLNMLQSFKPYYKWITFNTYWKHSAYIGTYWFSFKPYYKWITFNTLSS